MVLWKTASENNSGFYVRAAVALRGSNNPGAAAGSDEWYQLCVSDPPCGDLLICFAVNTHSAWSLRPDKRKVPEAPCCSLTWVSLPTSRGSTGHLQVLDDTGPGLLLFGAAGCSSFPALLSFPSSLSRGQKGPQPCEVNKCVYFCFLNLSFKMAQHRKLPNWERCHGASCAASLMRWTGTGSKIGLQEGLS